MGVGIGGDYPPRSSANNCRVSPTMRLGSLLTFVDLRLVDTAERCSLHFSTCRPAARPSPTS